MVAAAALHRVLSKLQRPYSVVQVRVTSGTLAAG